MIQRIQTIYLLIITIAMSLTLSLPTMTAISPDGVDYALSALRGFYPINEGGFNITFTTIWFSIFTAIVPILSLFIIGLFKRRTLQVRLSIYNMILMIGFYGLFFYTRHAILQQMPMTTTSYNWPIILPAISAILSYLAIRAILKDEALVRSLDRLR